ncbi:MAG TPA: tetratricopeptide repeat protein [Anaeromyxobacteraceae bacterium]|nr:tetratricopeptide repeat protein [Anaeromyxobacteraceae bacterium]
MPFPHRSRLGRGAPARAAALAVAALACSGAPPRPPGDPRAGEHYAAGEQALQAKRFAEATRELEQAVALAPTWAPARLDLGWARFHAGAFEAAEADFRAAAGLDPKDPRCRRALGSALYVQGRFGEAAPEMERWVDLSGGPIRAGPAAILWALALRRAGGASAARATELLEQWTSPASRFTDFSGTAAQSHVLEGPPRTLGLYLLDDEEEEAVMAKRWGGDSQRGFARYVVAADLLVRGKLVGARERLQKLAEPTADDVDDLPMLVMRAFARADLKSLPPAAPAAPAAPATAP